jgi:hypoxanthine phosphoribosyltransferase
MNDVPMRILFDERTIAARVAEMAAEISRDYPRQDLVALTVLKGAWVFSADLLRKLTIPIVTDFVTMASYGAGTETGGEVRIVTDMTVDIVGMHVLVVEDIVDTGLTTRKLLDTIESRRPKSVALCALLDKPARRRVEVPIRYTGFTVENRFIVGYGLDHGEVYRNLPFLAELVGVER